MGDAYPILGDSRVMPGWATSPIRGCSSRFGALPMRDASSLSSIIDPPLLMGVGAIVGIT